MWARMEPGDIARAQGKEHAVIRGLLTGCFLTLTGGIFACQSTEDVTGDRASEPSVSVNQGGVAGPTGGVNDQDAKLAEIAQDVPGFAGLSFDPAGNHYVINSTIAEIEVEEVRAALIEHYPEYSNVYKDAVFVVAKVEYGAAELNQWYQEMIDVVVGGLPDEFRPFLGFWDLDEANNRVVIAFSNEEARAWARQQIRAEIDAPTGAIVVIHEEPAIDD
jgi:hypothetical protein